MYLNKPAKLHSALSLKLLQWTFVLLITLLVTGGYTVQATSGIPPNYPNIPNDGDSNNDGIADVQQPNVASVSDMVTGEYITLELDQDCTIGEIYTNLAETLADYDKKYSLLQGLLYFEARCSHTHVALYFHGLHSLDPHLALQKYGPQIPGDTNTIGWYRFPNATFDTVIIDGQTVVRASYTLTDGQWGDDTGVDGLIVDPVSAVNNTDVDNVVGFLMKNYTASIQQGTATVTVIRTGSQGALSIDYTTADNTALAGQDYQATNGTLSWADGERGEKTVTVNLLGSATIGRTFTVTLDNLTGGNNPSLGINLSTVTITNDSISVTPPTTTPSAEVNFVSFATINFSARKPDGLAILTVVRKGTTDAMSVDYATSDDTALAGRDYQPAAGTLSWAEGDMSEKTILIILPSTAITNTNFLVTLSHLITSGPKTILGLNPTVVTINDLATGGGESEANNLVSFSTKNFTASRNGGAAVITVNRNGTQGAVSVNYTTSDNTAITGLDYQPATGTLTWAEGERGDKLFTVNLLNTATVGSVLNVTLSELTLNAQPAPANTSLGINTATLQITDEPVVEPPQTSGDNLVAFVANSYNLFKTDGLATLNISRSGNTSGSLSVDYATQDGNAIAGLDYQPTNGTLSWADGDSEEKSVTVNLLASATAGKTFIVRLSHLAGAPGQISGDTAVLTIFDNATSSGGITPGTSSEPVTQITPTPVIISNPDSEDEIYDAGGQELPATVSGKGSISNAIVSVDTINYGLLSNLTVMFGVTLSGGQLTGTIINDGTIKDVEFLGISLSGGTLAGTILNNSLVGGVIRDVTLAPNTVLSGGKLGGTIIAAADSIIRDVNLEANTIIQGGIMAGRLRGDPNAPATISKATFLPGTILVYVNVISPVEWPDSVVVGTGVSRPSAEEIAVNNVLAPTQIQNLEAKVLSTLPPEAMSELGAEQIQHIPPAALNGLTAEQSAALSPSAVAALSSEQVAQIPPVAFTGFSAEQIAVLTLEAVATLNSEQVSQIPPTTFQKVNAEQLAVVNKEALTGMTPAQFFYLPTESLSGLTSANMGGLSPAVINQFTPDQLNALQPTEFQKMPAAEVGKLVTNVDTNKVSINEVAPLIPPSWTLNPTTGDLTPPVGTPLSFQELPPPEETSPLVILPPLSNLESSFGIGGQGEVTAQEEMNVAIQQTAVPQFTLSQDSQGIVEVKGAEEYETVDFSFMCPIGTAIQADPQTPPTVAVIEGGFYQVTTATAQQFTMIPVSKDPENLSQVLQDSSVIVGKRGDVFLEVPNSVRQSSGRAREVVMFDSLIEPAPADFCEEIAGEIVCNFENAPLEQQPGIHDVIEEGLRQKTGVPKKKKMVYSDGTAQILYPTVLSPEIFIDQVQKTLAGVKKVILQANGMFKMSYQGNRYLVTPSFGVKSRELKKTEQIKPSIVLQTDGHLIYTAILDRKQVAAGTRAVRAAESGAREVLVFDLLLELAPEEFCKEIDGIVVCEFGN